MKMQTNSYYDIFTKNTFRKLNGILSQKLSDKNNNSIKTNRPQNRKTSRPIPFQINKDLPTTISDVTRESIFRYRY